MTEWDDSVRAILENLRIDEEFVAATLERENATVSTLSAAWALGLLATKDVVAALLSRLESDAELTETELHVALTLPDELEALAADLTRLRLSAGLTDEILLGTVEAVVVRSWNMVDDPLAILIELLTEWNSVSATRDLRMMRPKGFDRFYFGRAAQRRSRRLLASLALSHLPNASTEQAFKGSPIFEARG